MHNRIKELREARGLTQSQLAEAVGVHWQTIQRLEGGKTKLDTDWMEKLAPPLEVDAIDLVINRPKFRTVQVRGYVQAGHWEEAWELPEDDRAAVAVPDDAEYRHVKLFGVETRGPSMNRRYPEGTVVVVADLYEHGEEPVPGRRYVVERERADGMREATVKTLWRDDEGKLWLVPESTDPRFQQPIAAEGEAGDLVRIIGRVVYAVLREP